jgi:hypothetical protein
MSDDLFRQVTYFRRLAASRGECLVTALKALEFYANDRNYDEETGAAGKFIRIPSTPDQAPGEFAFEHDGGEVAKKALLAISAQQRAALADA